MADNYRVMDCRVDELQTNLNLWAGEFTAIVWNIYDHQRACTCPENPEGNHRTDCARPGPVERRVTVVMSRLAPMPVALPPGFDPRGNRRN